MENPCLRRIMVTAKRGEGSTSPYHVRSLQLQMLSGRGYRLCYSECADT